MFGKASTQSNADVGLGLCCKDLLNAAFCHIRHILLLGYQLIGHELTYVGYNFKLFIYLATAMYYLLYRASSTVLNQKLA